MSPILLSYIQVITLLNFISAFEPDIYANMTLSNSISNENIDLDQRTTFCDENHAAYGPEPFRRGCGCCSRYELDCAKYLRRSDPYCRSCHREFGCQRGGYEPPARCFYRPRRCTCCEECRDETCSLCLQTQDIQFCRKHAGNRCGMTEKVLGKCVRCFGSSKVWAPSHRRRQVTIERFTNVPHMEIGEGPHWSVRDQSLYWVDIRGPKIFKYNRRTNKIISIKTNSQKKAVGFIVPVKGKPDHFVIGEKLSLVLIHWDTKKNKIVRREVLVTVYEPNSHRLNDGKCDRKGRIWFGTMTDGRPLKQVGSYYSYSPKEGLKTHINGTIWVSNGIAFSRDNKKMWYIDSLKYVIDEYSFDLRRGKLKRYNKSFVNITAIPCIQPKSLPDGMTIDSDDNLWVAVFFGGRILQINPRTGKILAAIRFPLAHQITSVSFGGRNFDELYVTSADELNDAQTRKRYPESGSLYRITGLGVKGVRGSDFVL